MTVPRRGGAPAHLPPRLMTPAQVAVALGKTPEALRKMRQRGKGPKPTRLSERDVRYHPQDVSDYINNLRQKP
ncbi:DNA-binding protein [Brevibacterium permense]|uniref:helix-turn-helix transcriptional regulator n=1 Tax=Brevibacterium permense TaxID=234834 RepID=UPI0021CE6923|nr:helix-turn-helix domain-containing protein [Brevibacterium permense]MCU4295485.1 DNA-binding protein [Brevibacterium permense]